MLQMLFSQEQWALVFLFYSIIFIISYYLLTLMLFQTCMTLFCGAKNILNTLHTFTLRMKAQI